jgi:hypothetical protein
MIVESGPLLVTTPHGRRKTSKVGGPSGDSWGRFTVIGLKDHRKHRREANGSEEPSREKR